MALKIPPDDADGQSADGRRRLAVTASFVVLRRPDSQWSPILQCGTCRRPVTHPREGVVAWPDQPEAKSVPVTVFHAACLATANGRRLVQRPLDRYFALLLENAGVTREALAALLTDKS